MEHFQIYFCIGTGSPLFIIALVSLKNEGEFLFLQQRLSKINNKKLSLSFVYINMTINNYLMIVHWRLTCAQTVSCDAQFDVVIDFTGKLECGSLNLNAL